MTERKSRPGKPAVESPRGRTRAVADIVPEVGGAAFRRFGFVQSAIVSRWGEIVGPRYAGVSAPESIRFPAGKRCEGVLALAVSSGHAPMMQHVAPAIIERVNRFFGYSAIVRVAIRQGAIPPARIARPAAAPKPVPAELGDSLRAIADPELRQCLAALAGALTNAVTIPVIGKVR